MLRLPSIVAFATAAAGIAVIGSRLVSPRCGLLAGLLYAGSPFANRYALEARSYALITALTVLASLLFIRLVESPTARRSAGYGAGLACLGLFHLFALLIVAAHLATLLLIRREGRLIRLWIAAVTGAVVLLSPLIAVAVTQRGVLGWLRRPGWAEVSSLVSAFTGTRPMALLLGVALLAGVVAARSRGQVDLRALAVPWLVVPAGLLLSISQFYPSYLGRYVIGSLPALALLAAAGLARLPWRAWLVPIVLLGVLVAPLQESMRRPAHWPDHLREAAAILDRRARPTDAIAYIPINRRAVAEAYPASFKRLRDVGMLLSPTQAANFGGTEVDTTLVSRRLSDPTVTRVWLVEGETPWRGPGLDAQNQAKIDTIGQQFRQIGQWRVRGLTLSLYGRGIQE